MGWVKIFLLLVILPLIHSRPHEKYLNNKIKTWSCDSSSEDPKLCEFVGSYLSNVTSTTDKMILNVMSEYMTWKLNYPSYQLQKLCKLKAKSLIGKLNHDQRDGNTSLDATWVAVCLRMNVCGEKMLCSMQHHNLTYQRDVGVTINHTAETTRDWIARWRHVQPEQISKFCKSTIEAFLENQRFRVDIDQVVIDMLLCYIYYEDFVSGFFHILLIDPNQYPGNTTVWLKTSSYLKELFPGKNFNRLLDYWDGAMDETPGKLPLTGELLDEYDPWILYLFIKARKEGDFVNIQPLLQKIQNEDPALFEIFCSNTSDRLHELKGNSSVQVILDISSCLKVQFCLNPDCSDYLISETSQKWKHFFSNSTILYLKDRTELFFGPSPSEGKCKFCKAATEYLLTYNSTSKTNIKQVGYDFYTCWKFYQIYKNFQFRSGITGKLLLSEQDVVQYMSLRKDWHSKRLQVSSDAALSEFRGIEYDKNQNAMLLFMPSVVTLLVTNTSCPLENKIINLPVHPFGLTILSIPIPWPSFPFPWPTISFKLPSNGEMEKDKQTTTEEPPSNDTKSENETELSESCPFVPYKLYSDGDKTESSERTDSLERSEFVLSRVMRAVGDYSNKHFLQPPLTYPDSTGCFYLINEINTANPRPEPKEYIEYRKNCAAGKRLDASKMYGHWSINVRGSNPPAIYLIIDHDNHKMTKIQNEVLFTIGSPPVGPLSEKFDIDFNHESVQHTAENWQDILPDGNDVPHGIILLKTSTAGRLRELLKLPVINGKKSPLIITAALIPVISTQAIDCVFYQSASVFDHCEVFDQLCPKIIRNPSQNYIQRDWQGDDDKEPNFSISRCVTHPYPFDPFGYKMTRLSPGKPNGPECGVGTVFIISDNIQYMIPLVPGSNEPLQETAVVEAQTDTCSSQYLPQDLYAAVSHDVYKKELQKEMLKMQGTCGLAGNPNSNLGNIITGLRLLKDYASQRFPESEYGPYIWNQPVSSDMYDHVILHQSNLLTPELLKDPRYGWWIGHIPDPDPALYRFYCKICSLGLKSNAIIDRVSSTAVQEIMTEHGMLFTGPRAKYYNDRGIVMHARWPQHVNFVEFGQERANTKEFMKRKVLKEAVLENIPPEERHFEFTKNFFILAMNHIQTNAALTTFENSIKSHSAIADIYGFLYQNYRGLRRVVVHVSEFEHQLVLNEVKLGMPLSVMFDGYMDKQGKSYVGIFFYMYLENTPQVVFYKALPLGLDQSSKGYSQTMFDAFKEDGIYDTITTSMVALAADGASVNQGRFQSVYVEYQKIIKHPILFMWCSPHRVNLILKPVLEENTFKEMKSNLDFVNKVYTLYGPTTKLRGRLAKRLKESGSRIQYLGKTQPTRWAASQVRAIGKEHRHWPEIETETKEVASDTTIKKETRDKAVNIHDEMICPHFLTKQCFLLGLFKSAMLVSTANQRHNSPAIDQAFSGNSLHQGFENLRKTGGKVCDELFENMECGTGDQPVTLQDVESKLCKYKGVQLKNPAGFPQEQFLSNIKDRLLNRLKQQVHKYFDPKQMKQFQIFDPRFFPLPVIDDLVLSEDEEDENFEPPESKFMQAANEHGEEAFHDLALSMGHVSAEKTALLYARFVKMIIAMATDPLFMELRTMTPSVFWKNSLLDSNLPWTPDLKDFINRVLVIPSGISQVESLFSELTGMLGTDRLLLLPELVDHLLRIKHRIPKNLESWNPFYHIVSWLEKNNCRTDDETCRGRSQRKRPISDVDQEDLDDDDFDMFPDDDNMFGLD